TKIYILTLKAYSIKPKTTLEEHLSLITDLGFSLRTFMGNSTSVNEDSVRVWSMMSENEREEHYCIRRKMEVVQEELDN
nr:hypothetical protein [Tanacetum cinerariifolium]